MTRYVLLASVFLGCDVDPVDELGAPDGFVGVPPGEETLHRLTFTQHAAAGPQFGVDDVTLLLDQAATDFQLSDRVDDLSCCVGLELLRQRIEVFGDADCIDDPCLRMFNPNSAEDVFYVIDNTDATFAVVDSIGDCRLGVEQPEHPELEYEGPNPMGCAPIGGQTAVVEANVITGSLSNLRRTSIPHEVVAHEFGHLQGLRHRSSAQEDRRLFMYSRLDWQGGPDLQQDVVNFTQCEALLSARDDGYSISLQEDVCR